MGDRRYGGRGGYSPSPRGGRGRGGYSPSPRNGRGGRSRSRSRQKGGGKGGIPKGQHKVTIENLPEDMNWTELKELVREHGRSLTFARTFQYRGAHCGMVEFEDRRDSEAVFRELDNRRIEGGKGRLRLCYGDLSQERDARRYGPGERADDRGGRGYQGRDDRSRRDYDDRYRGDRDRGGDRGGDRGYDRDRGYDDRRRDERSPPRRYERRDDEPIMTLFVMDLPDDARDGEVMEDLEKLGAQRAMIMKKGGEAHAFVRFGNVDDAERAMDDINSGKVKVCGQKARTEMARRNTGL